MRSQAKLALLLASTAIVALCGCIEVRVIEEQPVSQPGGFSDAEMQDAKTQAFFDGAYSVMDTMRIYMGDGMIDVAEYNHNVRVFNQCFAGVGNSKRLELIMSMQSGRWR